MAYIPGYTSGVITPRKRSIPSTSPRNTTSDRNPDRGLDTTMKVNTDFGGGDSVMDWVLGQGQANGSRLTPAAPAAPGAPPAPPGPRSPGGGGRGGGGGGGMSPYGGNFLEAMLKVLGSDAFKATPVGWADKIGAAHKADTETANKAYDAINPYEGGAYAAMHAAMGGPAPTVGDPSVSGMIASQGGDNGMAAAEQAAMQGQMANSQANWRGYASGMDAADKQYAEGTNLITDQSRQGVLGQINAMKSAMDIRAQMEMEQRQQAAKQSQTEALLQVIMAMGGAGQSIDLAKLQGIFG